MPAPSRARSAKVSSTYKASARASAVTLGNALAWVEFQSLEPGTCLQARAGLRQFPSCQKNYAESSTAVYATPAFPRKARPDGAPANFPASAPRAPVWATAVIAPTSTGPETSSCARNAFRELNPSPSRASLGVETGAATTRQLGVHLCRCVSGAPEALPWACWTHQIQIPFAK